MARKWLTLKPNMEKSSQSIRNRLLVARLPAMPQILLKLIDLCQRDKASMGELAKVIAHDAGMATKVLSVANSTAYNRSNRKVGLMQALNTLGIEALKTLVISESVFQTFSNFSRPKGTDLHGFWVRSLKTAALSRELAKKMSYPHVEEAYLAGLLHDVGKLALLSIAPREYASNFMAKDDERLCSIENSSMGITHADAGAWLIEQWGLDSFLADGVRYHHEPIARLESAHPLIRLVRLAHLLSNYKSDSPALEGAGAFCGVDDTDLKSMLSGVNAQTKTSATYFGIDLTETDQKPPSAEYEPLESVRDLSKEKLAGEVRNLALISAAAQTFSHIHSGKELIESITRTARILFNLEDVVVLLQDTKTQVLAGVPIGNNQQRLAEFLIPSAGGSILAESVMKRKVTFVGRDDTSLGLVEEQLLRTMGTEYMAYLPLLAGPSCLGVLACGLSPAQSEELLGRERFLQSFATQAAVSLDSSTAAREEIEKQIARVNAEHREASLKIAHEVNNPLTIIKNYLGVFDDKVARDEPVTEELSILSEEIDRVSRIVGGLAGRQPVQQVETTEVNSLLNEVVRLFSISRYLPTSVNIAVRTADQRAEISGTADPLKQILLNLIKNAVEALPGGGSIEVRNKGRSIREGRAYIELSISDTGPGIPADVMASLFSPVRSSKREDGRGLGLSIVHSLVKKMNGSINCRSGKGGTTFEILIPVAANLSGSKPTRAANIL